MKRALWKVLGVSAMSVFQAIASAAENTVWVAHEIPTKAFRGAKSPANLISWQLKSGKTVYFAGMKWSFTAEGQLIGSDPVLLKRVYFPRKGIIIEHAFVPGGADQKRE